MRNHLNRNGLELTLIHFIVYESHARNVFCPDISVALLPLEFTTPLSVRLYRYVGIEILAFQRLFFEPQKRIIV